MKTKIVTKTVILLIMVIAVRYAEAKALAQTEKVLAEKTFEINPDALLFIDHEFGSVNCHNWDKNSISIKVTVHAEKANAEQAQKIINRIQLEVSGDRNKVSSVCKMLNNSTSNSVSFSIDLEVFMPKSINLQLKHKFGPAYVEEVDGEAKFRSEYGSIIINSLLNSAVSINVSFGTAEVKKMIDGNLDIDYSKLKLMTGNNVSINSQYSDLEIGTLGKGIFSVEGGSINIEFIDQFRINSRFSNIELNNLNVLLEASVEYGNMNINFIKAGFLSLDIVNKFGNINLKIDKTAVYKVNVETNFGGFSYPESLATFSNRTTTTTGGSYSGVIGKGNSSGSILSVRSSYGHINVEAK